MAKKKKSSKSKGKKSKGEKRVEVHYVSAPPSNNGIMAGIKKLLPESASEQFLIGVLIGGGAAYVLSDEQLRRHIIRYGLQTYGNIMGGLEELKEQVADIQAEIRVEQAASS